MVFLRDISRPIILASGSPRRSLILNMMGIGFETAKSGVIDEDAYLDLADLDGSLRRLSEAKAEKASVNRPEALVLGADTTVVRTRWGTGVDCYKSVELPAPRSSDIEVLGKPADKDDAARMLRKLSGSSHTVISAVALRCAEVGYCESVAIHTTVFFRELGEDEIAHYLSFPEYQDKAGSYAVQGGGMTFIDRIEGCYYNVMGLPVTATLKLLKEFIRKETTDGGNQ